MKRTPAIVIGCDSETLQGPPITFQFYSKEAKRINGCVFIGKRKAVDVFLAQLKKLKPGYYRMYGHNLEFDMLSFLWERRATFRDGNIRLTVGDWRITGRYSKPIFATFEDGKRTIELVDAMLWFQTSLENTAKIVCPGLPKLKYPKGLGTTLYTPKDTDFVAYAMRDAEVSYYEGVAIERFHDELEIPAQISLASMAAATFKLRYMRDDIYQPPQYEWMTGAAASYHGGVNRIKAGAECSWHRPVTSIDMSSAYPTAMAQFPAFKDPNRYVGYRGRNVRKIKKVNEHGIYRITGKTPPCDWPALFDHNFKPLIGTFKDTWVTGYELNEALRADEIDLSGIKGFLYDSDGEGDYSPFAEFVAFFYRMKNEAKDPIMRYMYKIMLNALTGKFIQTSPDYTLVDGKLVKIHRAGGLYHPMIASLITGHTRSHMHGAEHKYQSIHTATDGIFAPGRCAAALEKTLGAFVVEGFGDLALFRNKLYILYTDIATKDTYPSQVFEGRHILKCARHGFQGRVADLERMLITNDRTYRRNAPIKLKTALKQGEDPNKFITSERNLNVDSISKVFNYGRA